MKGLGQVQRQKSPPREDHRDADSAQDACATEEKAKLRGKWHRHSCVKFQDILYTYTALSGHPLHSRDGVTQRSTSVEHSLCGSSSRTRLRQ